MYIVRYLFIDYLRLLFKITNSKITNSKNYLCHHVHYQCGKIKNVGIFMAITKVDHSKYVIIIFKLFISLTFALGYLISITTLNDKIKSQWTILYSYLYINRNCHLLRHLLSYSSLQECFVH